MRLWKCEFCQKWYSKNVNFENNEILKMWILSKLRIAKCEFCENHQLQNMNFWLNPDFCPSVLTKLNHKSLPKGSELWTKVIQSMENWIFNHIFLDTAVFSL